MQELTEHARLTELLDYGKQVEADGYDPEDEDEENDVFELLKAAGYMD